MAPRGHQDQPGPNPPQESSDLNLETSTPLNLLPEERRELLRQQLKGLQPNPPQVYLETGGPPLHAGLAAIPPLPSLPSQGFSTHHDQNLLDRRLPSGNRTPVPHAATEPLKSQPQFENLRNHPENPAYPYGLHKSSSFEEFENLNRERDQERQVVDRHNGQLSSPRRPDITQGSRQQRSGHYGNFDPRSFDYPPKYPSSHQPVEAEYDPALQQRNSLETYYGGFLTNHCNQERSFRLPDPVQDTEAFPSFEDGNQRRPFGNPYTGEEAEPSSSRQQHRRGRSRALSRAAFARDQAQGFQQEGSRKVADSAASRTFCSNIFAEVENARIRRSLTPPREYNLTASNSHHQQTDERQSRHNCGRAESGTEHAEDSNNWITDDDESERGDLNVLPVIYNLRPNTSQFSVYAASSRRRHRTSIKSRTGPDTSAYSARSKRRKRERAKKAAIALWNRLGGAKNKPAALHPSIAAQKEASASSAQDDIFAAHLKATGNRSFSGTGGGGLFPAYKPNTPFVTVLEKTDDFIKQQRASRSSAGDFVPPKAKRNLTDKFKSAFIPAKWRHKEQKRRRSSGKQSRAGSRAGSPTRQQPLNLPIIEEASPRIPESPVGQGQPNFRETESQIHSDHLRRNSQEHTPRPSEDTRRPTSILTTPSHLNARVASPSYTLGGKIPSENPECPTSPRSPWPFTPAPELHNPRTRQRINAPERGRNSTASQHVRDPNSFDSHDQSSPHKSARHLNDHTNTSDAAVFSSPSHTEGTHTAIDLQNTQSTGTYVWQNPELGQERPRRQKSCFQSDFAELLDEAIAHQDETLAKLYEQIQLTDAEIERDIDQHIALNREHGAAERLRTGQLKKTAYDIPPNLDVDQEIYDREVVRPRARDDVIRQTLLTKAEEIGRKEGLLPDEVQAFKKLALNSHKRLSQSIERSNSQRAPRQTPAARQLQRAYELNTNTGLTSPAPSSPWARRQATQASRGLTLLRPAPSFAERSGETGTQSDQRAGIAAVGNNPPQEAQQHAEFVIDSQFGLHRDRATPAQLQEPQAASQAKFGGNVKSAAARQTEGSSFDTGSKKIDSRDQPGSKLWGVELKPIDAQNQQDSDYSIVSNRSREQQTSSSTGQGEKSQSGRRTLSEEASGHRSFRGIPDGRERLASNESQYNRSFRDLPVGGHRVASNESQQDSRGRLSPSLKNTSVAQLARKFQSADTGGAQDSTGDKVIRDQEETRVQSKVPRDIPSQSGEISKGKKSSSGRDIKDKDSLQTSFQEPGQDKSYASGSGTSDVPAALPQPGRLDPVHGRSTDTPPTSGSRLPRPVARLTSAIGARRDLHQTKERRVTAPGTNHQRQRGPEIAVNTAPSQSRIQQPAASARSVTGPASTLRSPDHRSQNNRGRKSPKPPFLGSHPQ